MADAERGTRSSEYAFLVDLTIVLVLTALSLAVIFLSGLRETPFRFVFGIVFVGFLPGYAVVAALFPEYADRSDAKAGRSSTETPLPHRSATRSLDGIERVVLSVGLSIVIIVLLGLVLNYTPSGIRLIPVAVLLTTITVTMTVVAAIRRWRLDGPDRYRVPIGGWIGAAYAELVEPNSKVDALLNAVIVVAILITVSSLTYAAAVPHDGEQYTELYLLTESGDELVAENYPRELASGESQPLVVGIDNHERETVEYSVVVELQRVETDDGETQVVERQEIERLDTSLASGEQGRYDVALSPELIGEDQRVAVMLYVGEAPNEPALDDTYRSVHLWVDVVTADGGPEANDVE